MLVTSAAVRFLSNNATSSIIPRVLFVPTVLPSSKAKTAVKADDPLPVEATLATSTLFKYPLTVDPS